MPELPGSDEGLGDELLQRVALVMDERRARKMEQDVQRSLIKATSSDSAGMRQALSKFNDPEGVKRALDKMVGQHGIAAKKTENLWKGTVGRIGGFFSSMQGMMVGLGVGFVGKMLLDVNREAQSLQAQLKVTEGGEDDAKARFAAIEEFATKTPFQIDEVTKAFLDLRTAGVSPTAEMLESFGDIASARGKNIRDFTMAVQDALTGEMERMKEFGIVSKQQGDKVAFTFNGQTTVVNRTRGAILDYLVSVGKAEGVQGSMAGQMATLNGVISNLWDNVGALGRIIGEEGFTGAALGAGQSTLTWTQKLNDNRESIGIWTRGIIGLIAVIVQTIVTAARVITNTAQMVFEGMGLIVGSVILAFQTGKNEFAEFVNWVITQANRIPGIRMQLKVIPFDTTETKRTISDLATAVRRDATDLFDSLADLQTSGQRAINHTINGGTQGRVGPAAAFGDGSVIGGNSGVGAGVGGKAKDAVKDEISNLTTLHGLHQLTARDMERAFAIERQLQTQLAATNLTLAQRAELRQKANNIGDITGMNKAPTGRVADSASFSFADLNLTPEKILPHKTMTMLDESWAYLRDNASMTADYMTEAFAGFFDQMALGIRGEIDLMDALANSAMGIGAAIVSSLLEGWAGYAMMRGTAALAEGTWPPNPAAILSSSLWFSAAGLAKSLGGALGGVGRGASRPASGRDAGLAQAAKAQPEPITVQVGVDPFNPENPVHARATGRAVALDVRLGGRPDWVRS